MTVCQAKFRDAFAASLTRLAGQTCWLGSAWRRWLEHLEPWTDLAWLVVAHNRAAGLTRITAPEEMAAKHFLDSLAPLTYDIWRPGTTVVDVGSGAGFPGLALAIALPGIHVTLIEASSRKAAFLEKACERLGVRADVIHIRAEDYGSARAGPGRERFDIGLARAAASFPASCELVIPLLRLGGSYVAQIGPADGERLELVARAGPRSESPWSVLGACLQEVRQVDLPADHGRRYVALFGKRKPTPRKFPRRAGIPGRNPLPGFDI